MLWILSLLSILGLMYGYINYRLKQSLQHQPRIQRNLRHYLLFCWLSSPAPMALRMLDQDGAFADALAWMVNIHLGFFSLLFIWLLVTDLLNLSLQLPRMVRRWFASPPHTLQADRRAWMQKSVHVGVLGVCPPVTALGVWQAVRPPVVREVHLPIPHLPEALKTLRIVQFTDLHIGPTIKRKHVEGIVQQINALQPDIIVMTGDLVDGSVAHLSDDVAPLAKLNARYGKFFVTGNHEYYSGVMPWLEKIAELGLTTLLNAHQMIEHDGVKILLAGVTDYRAQRYEPTHASSPAQAIQGAPETDLRILLAHQPSTVFEASQVGFDLQISGHTHGGQYYPWNLIAKMANPYIQGLHHHDGKTWIYVSPGTGYWGPPIRLGTEPEITFFRLG